MADAKITLETVVQSESLKQLNQTIAETNTKYKEAQAAAKEFEKQCGGVANMTAEQKARYTELNTTMQQYRDILRSANSEKNKEIRGLTDSAKAAESNVTVMGKLKDTLASISPVAGQAAESISKIAAKYGDIKNKIGALASGSGSASGVLRGITAAAGGTAVAIAGVAAAVVGVSLAFAKMGANAQQSFARLKAFTGNVAQAKALSSAIGQITRQTQFSRATITQMMTQLIALGMSASKAAKTVTTIANAAYGLGKGEQFAAQITTTFGKMAAAGKLEEEQLVNLRAAGVDTDEAFKSMGLTTEQVMKGLKDGTVDGAAAMQALIAYMEHFDGATATATDNFNDNFNRMEQAASGVLSAIGSYFADAFNQSGLLQALMELFDAMSNLIKGPLSGAFEALGGIAGFVLTNIANIIKIISVAINIIAGLIRDAGDAFNSACATMKSALSPVYDFLMDIVSAIGAVMRGLAQIGAKIADNAKAYAKSGQDKLIDSSLDVTMGTGHSMDKYVQTVPETTPIVTSTGGGGGSSARSSGGASGASPEELAKKKHEEELKALKEENRLSEERLVIENKLADIKAGLQTSAQKTLLSLQKQFGTDQQKISAEMKEADLEYNEKVLKERLRYKQEELQLANKLKEAEFDGKTNAAALMRQRIALAGSQHKATLKQLGASRDSQKETVQIKAIDDDAARLRQTRVERQLYQLEQKRLATVRQIELTGIRAGRTQAQIAKAVADANEEYDFQKEKLEIVQERQNTIHDAIDSATESLASGLTKCIMEGKSLGDVFKNVLQTLIEAVIQAQILSALKAIGLKDGGAVGYATGGIIERHANGLEVGGGQVFGHGTATSDSILTRLSRGEYVIKADTVDKLGVSTLDAINAGKIPAIAAGIPMGGNSQSITLNVSALDASSFKSFLRKGGLNNIKQAMLNSSRAFASDKGVW